MKCVRFCGSRVFLSDRTSVPCRASEGSVATNGPANDPQMPDDESQSLDEQQSTGYVPGDAWGNRFRYTFGLMTDEGLLQRKQARDDRNEAADCARCEQSRDYLLMYSESASAFW